MTDQPNDATSSSHDAMADEPIPEAGSGSDRVSAEGGGTARQGVQALKGAEPRGIDDVRRTVV